MPRSRSYSRSPSRTSNKKSSRRSRSRDRSREKYGSSSRRRSRSKSRSKKVSSRYKFSPSRRRSRSGDRRRKSKYYSSSKKDYRRERSRSRDRDRYTKKRSRSSSNDSHSSNSSYSASSSSTVASKVSIKSEKELQVIPLKMPSHQPVVPTKNTLQFSSVDLVGDFVKPEIIEELNEDEFVPKHFQSGGKKHLPDNIKIDLNSESVVVTPKVEDCEKNVKQEEEDAIFHPNLFGDEAVRMDKWVRKLFTYRQKMFLSAEN